MTKKKVIFMAFVLCAGILSAQNEQAASACLTSGKAVLNEILPLTLTETQQLDSVFWAKWAGHHKPDVAFHEAMCGALTTAQHFKQYFKNELEKRSWVILNDDLNYFRNTQKLSDDLLEQIKPILQQRSKETAYAEYRFFTNSYKRNEAIKQVRDKYRNQISSATMQENSTGASYNLGLVLKNRKRLKLTDEQVKSIVSAVQEIRVLEKKGTISKAKNNRWLYERQYIMKYLKEEQVSDFLTVRNFDYSKRYAEQQWADMENYDIAFAYDSVKTVQEIIAYQLNKNKIEYIYRDDPHKLQEMDNYLYHSAYPKALRELRVVKRKNPDQDTKDKDELIF